MNESGVQKLLGALLFASGAALAVVFLGGGGEEIQTANGKSSQDSAPAESVKAELAKPATPPASHRQSQRWPGQDAYPHTDWSAQGQQPNSAPIRRSIQTRYDADSNFVEDRISLSPDQHSLAGLPHENTGYSVLQSPGIEVRRESLEYARRSTAPARSNPGYRPSRRLGQDPNPRAMQIDGALVRQPVQSNRTETRDASYRQNSGETSQVLQASYAAREFKGRRNEFELDSMAKPNPAPMVAPTPAIRIAQQPVVKRQRANPQVEIHARKRIEYGDSLSRRRSFYAAREEFILALILISKSHETGSNGSIHTGRLAQALTAMDEIIDFVSLPNSSTGNDQRFQQAVFSHKTKLLSGSNLSTLSPLKAIDLYCGFAQSQIEQAIGFSAAGSEALHALGKLESMAPNSDPQGTSASQTKALVFYRAALSVNPANVLCANDLGVLLFNMGRLNEAEKVLRHSLGHAQSHLAWKNLASVHDQQASLSTSADQRNYHLRLTKMAEQEAEKFQNNPRDRGLADDQWATTSAFQNNAAYPDTVVHRVSDSANQPAQPNRGRTKAASFIQKVTGWN